MKLRYYILLAFVLGYSGNQMQESNIIIPDSLFAKHPEFEVIEITDNQYQQIDIEDITQSISVTEFDSQNKSEFLPRIDDLATTDSSILINTRSNIRFYNLNGRLLHTFQNWGRGPGEHQSISGWSINRESNQMAIADSERRLLLYDLEGNFEKRIDLSELPITLTPNISYLNDNYMIIENDLILSLN